MKWVDKHGCECMFCERGDSLPFDQIDMETDEGKKILLGVATGRIKSDAFDVDVHLYVSARVGDESCVVRVEYGDEVTYVLVEN